MAQNKVSKIYGSLFYKSKKKVYYISKLKLTSYQQSALNFKPEIQKETGIQDHKISKM